MAYIWTDWIRSALPGFEEDDPSRSGSIPAGGGTYPGGGSPGGGPPGGGDVADSVNLKNVADEMGGGDGAFSYQTPTFGGPIRPRYNFGPVPGFNPPEFEAPNPQDVINDPSYLFRRDQSLDAIERSAAARGTLRGGGTLKGLSDYASRFASQEYSNIFDRALDVYDRQYQSARDQYSPRLLEWQTLSAANQRAGDLEWQRAWDIFRHALDDEFRREELVLNAENV